MQQLTLETPAVTVSAYSTRIERAVKDVGGALVEGEVQKPQRSRGGLLYFDITDGDATLSCKIFGRQIRRLQHTPKDGDLVQIKIERPDFWSTAGKLSLIVSDVKLAGVGELLRRRAELLKMLTAEGLCDPDRWKPLPAFPRAVGVIAARDSEGMSDVIRALTDRLPHAHIVTCPALVQGKSAPRDIIDALATLQQHPQVDVIVIARGGGQVRDLIAFDDERLCRAVFACAKPVVAAIGHTNNVPVCNHVTHAASTPSRSAEMVLPSLVEIRKDLQSAQQALSQVPLQVDQNLERVQALGDRLRRSDLLESRGASIAELSQRIARMETSFFGTREKELSQARATLETIPHRCRVALSGREQGIGEQRLHLNRAPKRTEEAIAGIADQARVLDDGIARQLADHQRDYGRAIDRLITDFPHRCRAALSGCEQGIGEQRLHLNRAPKRTEEAIAGIADQARVLDDGIARQLADHQRDYGRAIDRLITDFNRISLRRFEDERTRLRQASELTHERIGYRFNSAGRDLKHVASVIEARDFRRHGFVLATDASGKPVPSISGIRVGAHLDLKFRDGRARVAVRETEEEEA